MNENIATQIKDDAALSVAANTAFYETAIKSDVDAQSSILQISLSGGGVLTLTVDEGALKLNGGTSLAAGALYEFELMLVRGKEYNLKSSLEGTASVLWMGKGRL